MRGFSVCLRICVCLYVSLGPFLCVNICVFGYTWFLGVSLYFCVSVRLSGSLSVCLGTCVCVRVYVVMDQLRVCKNSRVE